MTKRQPFSTRFLYFVLFWCVFSFKVLLGAFGEAGIRVDDLLIVVAFVILVSNGDIVRIPRSAAFRAYLIFVLVNLCSAAWNGLAGRVAFVYSIIFVVRLLQYMVFYYLGYALLQNRFQVWRSLRIYFYVLCLVVPLQMVNLLPTASSFDASRASGNTNGPYELAAVSAFFLCYFGYRERKRLSAGLSIVLLILTASRSTLAGAVITVVMRTVSRSKTKLRAVTLVLLAMLVLWGCILWILSARNAGDNSMSLRSRLNSSSSLLSVDYQNLYATIPYYRTSEDYMSGMFLDTNTSAIEIEADRSGILRALRWAVLVKSTVAHFDSIVIGLGPSFGSAAVDGYYVRVFSETGLAGMVAFILFLRALRKRQAEQSGAFREFVTILIVTACFIDIFASYKTMLLLWLWNGMNEWEWRHQNKCV